MDQEIAAPPQDSGTVSADTAIATASLDAVQNEGALPDAQKPEYIVVKHGRGYGLRLAAIGLAICLLLGGAIFMVVRRGGGNTLVQSGNFGLVKLPLTDLQKSDTTDAASPSLQVNGRLQVAGSVVLNPSVEPSDPQSGQIYFDKSGKQLSYYDGSKFVAVGNSNVTNITNVNNTTHNVLTGSGAGVQLQPATPGTQQTGNFNVSGTGAVGKLQTTVISSDGGTLYVNPAGATAQQTIAAGTPATLGLTTLANSFEGPGWKDERIAHKVSTGAVGGTATSIAVYYANVTPGDHVQVALYDDDGDIPSKPSALLATSTIVTMSTSGWQTVTIPNTNLQANTTYWLAVDTDSTTVTWPYVGGNQVSCFVYGPFGSMPNPFQTQGCFPGNNNHNIYLNYLLGAGTSGALSSASIVIGPTGQTLFQNSEDSTTAFRVQNSAGTTTIFNIDTQNGRIGIGKTTPAYKLDIAAGDINLSNGRSLRYNGQQVLSTNGDGSKVSLTNFNSGGKITAQSDSFLVQDSNAGSTKLSIDNNGATTFKNVNNSTTAFRIQNAAGTSSILTVDTTNSVVTITSLVSTGNITVGGHIITAGTAPASTAGTAACTTPTVSVTGNDTSGTISVTTGTGCASGGDLATVTFATAFAAAPRIILTPGSSATLGLGAYVDNSTTTTTDFTIGTNTTPTDSTTYTWNYLAVQ